MAIKPDYQAGTVSITAGTTALVGAGGANWLGADIQPGDTFLVQNLVAVVAAVVDATHITLASNWTGTTLAAAPYRIRYQPDGSRYSAAARDLIDQLGNGNVLALSGLTGALDEIPIFTGAGAMTTISKTDLTNGVAVDEKVESLADRAAFDGQAEGFSVLVADVGDGRSAIYFKLSSSLADWSDPAFLTGANGTFQSKGAYSGATAYLVGEVVTQNGSSWIARVNTTGNPPPTLPTTSNTQWFLLAAAGSGFVFRGVYSGATAYVKDDVVFNQNSSWIALLSTTGNAPPTLPTTSNTQWQALAVRGAGDFSGPASSASGNIVTFGDTTGKSGVDSGVPAVHAIRMRNYAINPAMQASIQFGGSSSTALGTYVAEQWLTYFTTSTGVLTSQQVSSMTPKGSLYRYRVTVTTADTSLAAGEFLMIRQPFEGYRVSDFRFGSASAKRMLIRFGFKGPAGTYGLSITNAAANRTYVATFTISAGQANTDTEQLILIPGDVTGTWVQSNALCLWLNITLACGATYQGTAGVWQAGNFLGTSAVSNGMATAGSVFELFDVGVHLDDDLIGVAPKFEVPDLYFNLWECQRYFERVPMTVVNSGIPYTNTSWFKAKKRSNPALTVVAGSLGGATLDSLLAYDGTLGIRQVTLASGAADIFIQADSRF